MAALSISSKTRLLDMTVEVVEPLREQVPGHPCLLIVETSSASKGTMMLICVLLG